MFRGGAFQSETLGKRPHGCFRSCISSLVRVAEPGKGTCDIHDLGPVVCQNPVPKTGRWPSGVRARGNVPGCRFPNPSRDWTMGERRASYGGPMSLVFALLCALRAALRTRTDLTLENLALRQQLALLSFRSKRTRFGRLDRAF
jgi:hypothetical protein